MVAKGEQRCDVPVGDEPHVAALAAVPAVRPALRDVRFTPERNTTSATVSPAHVQVALVDEAGHE
jgi:hypothetical protein